MPLKLKAQTTSCSSIFSPSAIFLPHLQFDDEDDFHQVGKQDEEEEVQVEVEEKDDEEAFDPILDFFKSRSSFTSTDPKQEGRLLLQRNRRTSWRIANVDLATDVAEEEEEEEEESLVLESPSEVTKPPPNDGVVGEILGVARNLPVNTTLGDFLGAYAGRVWEGDCIELLGRMGEEGLAWGCLYLFEWMGLQEPSLVTPRACSILFPVLGKAGMGDKLLVLFQNLPKAKRFRDVCVYNSAISGLASCGR